MDWVSLLSREGPWVVIVFSGAWFFVVKIWPLVEKLADAWIANRDKERLLLEYALNQLADKLSEKDKMLLVIISDYKESVIGLRVEMEKWRRVMDETLGLLRGQMTPPFTDDTHPGRRRADR